MPDDAPIGDPSTLPEADAGPVPTLAQQVLGLVVVWAPADCALIGAWLPMSSETRILGRGPSLGSDPHPRLQAFRQRPGERRLLGPFASPALSRVQLRLRQLDPLHLQLENLGQCKLCVNEHRVDEATVTVGDVLQLGNQVLLLCCRRPRQQPPGEMLEQHPFGAADAHGFVGESPAMWGFRRELAFVGKRPGHVLIHGESGTGKELAAKAVHSISERKGRLVARNAATFPETLIDAELFGNAKGYPNPGMQERPGLIGAAHGGTLFLDEFAELPLTQQTRLLRVLDAGEYQRLGEAALRHSTVRLVAATNRPLSTLRPDVLTRFAFTVETPSLAVRIDDVSLLIRHLLLAIAREDTEVTKGFFARDGEPNVSAELVTLLIRRSMPGNVRDLRNILWRSLAESQPGQLTWPGSVQAAERTNSAAAPRVALPDDEAERIRQALDRHAGSIEQAWRSLGLSSRFALNRLMKKHGISLRKRTS